MTIISTAETVTPLDLGEGSLDLWQSPVTLEEALDIAEQRAYEKRTPSFPPLNDTIVWVKQVDWKDVRNRARAGVNNVGLVLAVVGAKIHDLGAWLAKV